MENPSGFGRSGHVQTGHGDQGIINDKKLGLVKRFGKKNNLRNIASDIFFLE